MLITKSIYQITKDIDSRKKKNKGVVKVLFTDY